MTPLESELDFASALVHALLDLRTLSAPLGIVELARRRAEALALFEAAPLPSAVFDASSRSPRVTNLAWRKRFGVGTLPASAASYVDTVARTGTTIHLAELAMGRDYFAVTFRPVRGGDGLPTGAIAVCSITTDAVVARRLGVDAGALIWSGPVSEGPDYFNAPWCAYTGDLQTWQHAIHPDDLARCTHAFGEAMRLRVASDVEARVRRTDGAYRWHRIGVVVGTPGLRWTATATDIDEVRTADAARTELLAEALAARADAEQANRLKDQFLAAVSHELRAPLTTMLLWEKVLRDDSVDAATHAQARMAIHESVHAQSRLVGDLLDVARGISGKLYIDLRSVDLARVAREAIDAAGPAARAKSLAIEHRGALVALEVQGDATRLRQVLDNLLSNAVKFTESGLITVAIRRVDRTVVIEVEDTGRGISPEFMTRIFEPFSQTDDALTRRGGGLGLGLAISRQLVELHEGTLVATSAGNGRGTKLTMSLPASAEPAPSPPLGMPNAPRLERTAILVVDDDRRVREALALLLDRAGAAVQTADSAASARERIATVPPDLVVCDIAMPDEDGYSFIRKLRAAGSAIPAIALTAHAMDADAARALDAGFDVHHAKPIDFERLVAKIDELIGAHPA